MPTTVCLHVGYWLRGKFHEETTVLETGDDRGGADEQAGGCIPGWGDRDIVMGVGQQTAGNKIAGSRCI